MESATRVLAMVGFVLATSLIGLSPEALAQANVYVRIGGQDLAPGQSVDLSGIYTTSYGNVTISAADTSAGAGNPRAEYLDGNADDLLLRNVKITANGTVSQDFPIEVWREYDPGPTTLPDVYYRSTADGEFGPIGGVIAGNKITISGYVTHPLADQQRQMGVDKSKTVCNPTTNPVCYKITLATSGKWPHPNPALGNTNRLLKLIVKFRLYHQNDYLVLNTGPATTYQGARIYNSPNAGGLAGEDDCPVCTLKSGLSVLCSTTHATATLFQCPSCVTDDPQMSQTEKASLFAKLEWDNLSQEIAQGGGEHLSALAALLAVPPVAEPRAFDSLQNWYSSADHEPLNPDALIAFLQNSAALSMNDPGPLVH